MKKIIAHSTFLLTLYISTVPIVSNTAAAANVLLPQKDPGPTLTNNVDTGIAKAKDTLTDWYFQLAQDCAVTFHYRQRHVGTDEKMVNETTGEVYSGMGPGTFALAAGRYDLTTSVAENVYVTPHLELVKLTTTSPGPTLKNNTTVGTFLNSDAQNNYYFVLPQPSRVTFDVRGPGGENVLFTGAGTNLGSVGGTQLLQAGGYYISSDIKDRVTIIPKSTRYKRPH